MGGILLILVLLYLLRNNIYSLFERRKIKSKVDKIVSDKIKQGRLSKEELLHSQLPKEIKLPKENEEKIKSRIWYPLDDEANQNKIDFEIKRIRNRVDIKRDGFNGFITSHFYYLFFIFIIEENHYFQ